MLAAAIPTDGVARVQKNGAFKIQRDTKLCIDDRLSADAAKKQIADCVQHAEGEPIIIKIVQSGGPPGERRKLTPYSLSFAAWQGDPAKGGAIWFGAVSRKGGTLRPSAITSADAVSSSTASRPQLLEEYSIGWDIFDLSKTFVRSLGSEGRQLGRAPSKAAVFTAFLAGNSIRYLVGSEEFGRNGVWTLSFAGADLQMVSGTWRVVQDNEGVLELCTEETEVGYPPAREKLKRPKTNCRIVKPFYQSNAFIDLPIGDGGIPRLLFLDGSSQPGP